MKQVPSTTDPIRMCYDTGTTPKSLCSKKDFFRELVLFDKPKFVTLADPDSVSKVVGQGLLDIIINNKYRMWMHAYLTTTSDALLSSADHLSYNNCSITGHNGIIKISYPTFQFDVLGSENFEFNILPGKSSNKPVLWKPAPENQITEISSMDSVKIKRLHPDATLPQNATNLSSGYDVSSTSSLQVLPCTQVTVPFGFAMSIPAHLQCELRP